MINISRFVIFLILFTNLSFRAHSQVNFIVAKVNEKAITNIELEQRYNFLIKSAKLKIKNDAEKNLITSQIIDKIIDEELIKQNAKEFKISNSDEEINQAAELIAIKKGFKSLKSFKYFIKKIGLTYENYISQIASEILWSKIINNVIKPKVKVSDFEVKEFLEQQKFNIKFRKFDISELVISNKQKNSKILANKLYLKLNNGANFKEYVRQFSNGFSANNNGKIGWVYKTDIDPKIYLAIKNLKKSQYSKPVLLADGFHIFRINDLKSEIKIPQDALKAARNAIFQRKLRITSQEHLQDLRKKSFIEIRN